MRVLVTGSAGHLGEGLVRTLRARGDEVIGVDIVASPFTDIVGSIVDPQVVDRATSGVEVVLHPATLHKPHVVTHARQQFVDTNITGTLNLLEASVRHGARAFVYTSTTSAFGDALVPPDGAPAAWITEEVRPEPKNIYGVTKVAAEDLCALFHRNLKLPCLILRTSRFFPEEDDRRAAREAFADDNLKTNEHLYRRVDLEDVVTAHLAAIDRASTIGFGRYIISATSPFTTDDLALLREDAPRAVAKVVPEYLAEYERRGWKMLPAIDRIYVNTKARLELGWAPRYDFAHVLGRLIRGEDRRSPLAQVVGSKGYHSEKFTDGPYPV
jgi:UDP-glucose 4-epimerase